MFLPTSRVSSSAPQPRACCARAQSKQNDRAPITSSTALDPEARFRRYGSDFGKKGYVVGEDGWRKFEPKKFRDSGERARDQFGELAVLNERLAGNEAWQIRQRVEYLKRKRQVWEGVYQTVGQDDVALTLATLENAINDVRTPFFTRNRFKGRRLLYFGAQIPANHCQASPLQPRLAVVQPL